MNTLKLRSLAQVRQTLSEWQAISAKVVENPHTRQPQLTKGLCALGAAEAGSGPRTAARDAAGAAGDLCGESAAGHQLQCGRPAVLGRDPRATAWGERGGGAEGGVAAGSEEGPAGGAEAGAGAQAGSVPGSGAGRGSELSAVGVSALGPAGRAAQGRLERLGQTLMRADGRDPDVTSVEVCRVRPTASSEAAVISKNTGSSETHYAFVPPNCPRRSDPLVGGRPRRGPEYRQDRHPSTERLRLPSGSHSRRSHPSRMADFRSAAASAPGNSRQRPWGEHCAAGAHRHSHPYSWSSDLRVRPPAAAHGSHRLYPFALPAEGGSRCRRRRDPNATGPHREASRASHPTRTEFDGAAPRHAVYCHTRRDR